MTVKEIYKLHRDLIKNSNYKIIRSIIDNCLCSLLDFNGFHTAFYNCLPVGDPEDGLKMIQLFYPDSNNSLCMESKDNKIIKTYISILGGDNIKLNHDEFKNEMVNYIDSVMGVVK